MICQRKKVIYKTFYYPLKKAPPKNLNKQSNNQTEQNNHQYTENYKQILLCWVFLLIIGVLIDKCNS